MAVAAHAAHPQVWMEGLGEWRWPGRSAATAEALPPSWVPAIPPRLEYAASPSAAAAPHAPGRLQRATTRRLGAVALLSALATLCVALIPAAPARVMEQLGVQIRGRTTAHTSRLHATRESGQIVLPVPTPKLVAVSHDAAGSAIDAGSYSSVALHGRGSFHVYLPPGYGGTTLRYPVLYLLHGTAERDTSFLRIGLQGMLDRLIARHAVPPLIAVMIQGGPGPNNWRDHGRHGYESYVLEVQEMLDRTLPTVADRAGRAIAGYSMGGYGAVSIALDHPERFAAAESWLGFFAGLGGELRASRPILSRIALHAFLYGGADDRIADPSGNAPFAAALRRAGARATSAVYPGGHSLDTLHAHLGSMLVYAGRVLSAASPPAR
jgi:enterochelin esterase-like enzyme